MLNAIIAITITFTSAIAPIQEVPAPETSFTFVTEGVTAGDWSE
jgi:hypothetical protein